MSDDNNQGLPDETAPNDPHQIGEDLKSLHTMLDSVEGQIDLIKASHPGEDFEAMLHDMADRLHVLADGFGKA